MLRIIVLCAAGLCAVLAGPAAHAQPQPITATTVDSTGIVGSHSSIAMRAVSPGGPVIAYYDETNGDLKLATCIASCDRTNPSWVIATVDSAGDVGRYPSLQMANGDTPVISYYDATNDALKLARCTAACATSSSTWVTTTVDRGTSGTGRFTSLNFSGSDPAIAYRNSNGDVKLAICTGGCTTATPTWSIITVDVPARTGGTSFKSFQGRLYLAYIDSRSGVVKHATCASNCTSGASWIITGVDFVGVDNDPDSQVSLAINEGFPQVTYYDGARGALKLATCRSACATGSPTWTIETIDSVGDAGKGSALVMNGGTPIIAYSGDVRSCMPGGGVCREAAELRLAVCDRNCADDWSIRTVDGAGLVGMSPSMTRSGDTSWISYFDASNGDLKMAVIELISATAVANHTSLWWDSQESGWGINVTHQGSTVFATLFTYDAAGEPLWLVMSNGAEQTRGTFSGTLYRTTGPSFDANPFTPIGPANITPVGTMTIGFAGSTAALTYDVNGAVVNKTLHKQVFGARAAGCGRTTSSRASLTNYQDLWWNPSESGWGINLTHQGDTIFATLFTYDGGRGVWYVMSAGTKQADGSYLGDLYRTRGPAFNASPFTPIGSGNLTRVGTLQLRFTNGESGTVAYSVNGRAVTKSITRQVFSSPVPFCG